MRKIKFRGQRVDNGEWVFGNLVKIKKFKYLPSAFKIVDEWVQAIQKECPENGLFYRYEDIEVIPETVGQYTGLKDKNGVEIYEGDILSDGNIPHGRVTYVPEHASYLIHSYNEEQGALYSFIESGNLQLMQTEIIGNIHDNPELVQEVPNDL